MFTFFEKQVDPYPDENHEAPSQGFFAFLWKCTEGCRRYIVGMMIFTAMIGVFEAVLFAIFGKVVDWLANIEPALLWQKEGGTLLLLAGIIISSTLLIAVQTVFKHQALSGNFPMRLRWNFHRLMLNQSMSFFQDEFAGRISTKVMQTSLAVRDTCMIIMDILVFIVIYFITMASVVGGFNILLLIPFCAWVILYGIAVYWFIPRLARIAQKQADARSLMTGRITDAYTNITTVKLFSHAGREAGYARSAMQEFMVTVYAQMRLVSGIEIINHIISMLLIISITAIALWLWTLGQIGVGALAAATAMGLRLNSLSHWIMWEMASLFENIGTVKDGINTFSRPTAVLDAPDAKKLTVNQGEIRFNHVNFYYNKFDLHSRKTVFEELVLTIRPGEKIGLVGRSGAGKSTLVNLLLRFYDVDGGEILIDGQNIAQVTQSSLREQIGMVTQDTSLLHRSVKDNILYGRPDASDDDVILAARRAEAHEFIETLVDSHGNRGYDALVGERGLKLSGGQRQRVAIARVMLKDAPILLLDEATSALDSEVETAIQTTLYRLMEGKTVVAIAHRLSTIAAMDRLVVLDQGRIIEEGDHHALLAKNGMYAQLWAHQSGGFLLDDFADSNK